MCVCVCVTNLRRSRIHCTRTTTDYQELQTYILLSSALPLTNFKLLNECVAFTPCSSSSTGKESTYSRRTDVLRAWSRQY